MCILGLATTYSPTLIHVVPSAQQGFTFEFGMGSCVSLVTIITKPNKHLFIFKYNLSEDHFNHCFEEEN